MAPAEPRVCGRRRSHLLGNASAFAPSPHPSPPRTGERGPEGMRGCRVRVELRPMQGPTGGHGSEAPPGAAAYSLVSWGRPPRMTHKSRRDADWASPALPVPCLGSRSGAKGGPVVLGRIRDLCPEDTRGCIHQPKAGSAALATGAPHSRAPEGADKGCGSAALGWDGLDPAAWCFCLDWELSVP